jgi:zinc D-Ala-D-Ala carboxypeptidase
VKAQLYEHYSEIPKGVWRWPNFKPREIACRGTGEIMLDFDALDKLQDFRITVGVPFTPNSAYRSISHNKAVGGSPKSMHLYGRAFDIPIKAGLTREKIKRAAAEVGFTGIGDYANFVHIDTGTPRYWDLRK